MIKGEFFVKKFICGLVAGTVLTSLVGAYAVSEIYENPYPIYVNGEQKEIQGYNIDGYSYFKLRDIAEATGKFDVDFQNDSVVIDTTGGYTGEAERYVTYYPYSDSAWLPDYEANTGALGPGGHDNVLCIEDNAIGFYYGITSRIWDYEYNPQQLESYIDLLTDLGFSLEYQENDITNEYGFVYIKQGSPIMSKDGNYVLFTIEDNQLTIQAFPGISPQDAYWYMNNYPKW